MPHFTSPQLCPVVFCLHNVNIYLSFSVLSLEGRAIEKGDASTVSGLQLGLGCITIERKKAAFFSICSSNHNEGVHDQRQLSFIKMKHQMGSHHGIKVLNA